MDVSSTEGDGVNRDTKRSVLRLPGFLGFHKIAVGEWVRRFEAEGIAGLKMRDAFEKLVVDLP